MILETTNPKYAMPAQVPAVRKCVFRTIDYDDSLGMGEWSRNPSRPIPEPEHEPDWRVKPRPFSIQVLDQAPDADLWLIIDRTTGYSFARVRGSLAWVVNQLRSVASQLGGLEKDLYFKRAE